MKYNKNLLNIMRKRAKVFQIVDNSGGNFQTGRGKSLVCGPVGGGAGRGSGKSLAFPGKGG